MITVTANARWHADVLSAIVAALGHESGAANDSPSSAWEIGCRLFERHPLLANAPARCSAIALRGLEHLRRAGVATDGGSGWSLAVRPENVRIVVRRRRGLGRRAA